MAAFSYLQGDYTVSSFYHQIKLPLDIEISIPSDDPVRLVSAFVEEMNLSDLYGTYDRTRKNQATPRQMLKIVIYAATNRIYLVVILSLHARETSISCTFWTERLLLTIPPSQDLYHFISPSAPSRSWHR